MKIHRIRLAVPALSAGLLLMLTGCTTMSRQRDLEDQTAAAAQMRQEAVSEPVLSNRSFVVNDGFYAARKPLPPAMVNAQRDLPAPFFRQASMNDRRPITLTEITGRITERLGYPVSISADVLKSNTDNSSAGGQPPPSETASAPGGGAPGSGPTALPPLPAPETGLAVPSPSAGAMAVQSGTSASPQLVLPEFVYTGNLAGLLDMLSNQLQISWRWTGSRIELFRYETRMFRLDALAGEVNHDANLNTRSSTGSAGGGGGTGGSSGASATGSSGQTTTINSTLAIWSDVEKSLEGVKSPEGKIVLSPSAGVITVHDSPAVLRQMEEMIAAFNRLYGRQVTLNVEVYAVERTADQQYGIDWSLVYNKASKYGYSLSSLGSLGSGGGVGGASGQQFRFTRRSGPWAGSTALFQALSPAGRTSLVTSNTVIASNGQTVPVNVAREQTYLQSYSTTRSGSSNGDQTTTLTPGVVTDGVAMSFTPRILENNDVVLRYALDLSTVEEITNFVTPDGLSSIQLPRRAVRNFLQNVTIHSGETLVLTGFQQAQGGEDGSGPITPKTWFLGGSRKANTLSRTIVIVVTPYVMTTP